MTNDQTTTTATTAAAPPERVETIVIGAGQTGLATAYHLTRAGRECLVVHEHTRVGDQWRERYDSLHLNTPAKYDSLPGMRFPAKRFAFPTGRAMGDYLETYADTMGLAVRGDTRVTSVDQLPEGGWLVSAGDATFLADNVVVGTGGEHHPKVPAFAGRLDPGIRQLHSHDYRNPGQLLPGPVLVVGVGQSGADIALELADAGHETLLSGTVNGEVPIRIESLRGHLAAPVLWFVANHVLTLRTPLGRKAQPRIRAGGTPLVRVKHADLLGAGVQHTESRTEGVQDGRPRLADGRILDVANVIWCTGFRQDFSFIHPTVTGPDGWPTDRGGVVPDSPGLFFVGLLFQRGFYSMLIGGAGRDAAHIARQIVAGQVRAGRRTDALTPA